MKMKLNVHVSPNFQAEELGNTIKVDRNGVFHPKLRDRISARFVESRPYATGRIYYILWVTNSLILDKSGQLMASYEDSKL